LVFGGLVQATGGERVVSVAAAERHLREHGRIEWMPWN
jgi:hypothetical protein